jgi:PAS domain S-box-containing protein
MKPLATQILLVTEDPELRGFLRHLVHSPPPGGKVDLAIELVEATYLEQIANLLQGGQFDLLLLGLPGKVDLDLIGRLRRLLDDKPILIVSDQEQTETVMAALQAGAEDYLVRQHLTSYWLRHAIRRALHHSTTKAVSPAIPPPSRRAQEDSWALLADLVAQAPAFAALLWGPEHTFVSVNSAYLHLIGGRDILGKPVREALPEVNGQGYFDILDQVYSSGEAFRGQEMCIQIQGEQAGILEDHYVTFSYAPLIAANDTVSGILVLGTDVTEHVQLRQQWQEAHAQLDAVFASTPVGLAFLNRELHIVRVNEALTRMIGATHSEHQSGITPTEVLSNWAEGAQLMERWREILTTGQPEVGVEISGITPGSPHKQRVLIASWYPVRLQGQIIGIGAVVEDATERKRAEQALRDNKQLLHSVLNSLTAHIAVIDQTGVIVAVNHAWERFALENGAPSGSKSSAGVNYLDVVRHSCATAVAGADAVLTGIEGVLHNELAQFQFEYPCHAPEKRRWFLLVVTPLHNSQGGAVIAHVEITERKLAEEERERLLLRSREEQAKLDQLNQTLESRVRERSAQVRRLATELILVEQRERKNIAQVLHADIQQLLYALEFRTELLRRSDYHAYSSMLDEMEEIIQEALYSTRTLTVDLSPPVLPGEGLVEALQWLAAQMQKVHRLTVVLNAQSRPHLPQPEMQDLIFQIVRELLLNVVKHADVARATVTVDSEDYYLVVTVSDKGRGFDIVQSQQMQQQRRGFGLFSIRERLDLFDGYAELHSAPGAGTEVKVVLPLSLTAE